MNKKGYLSLLAMAGMFSELAFSDKYLDLDKRDSTRDEEWKPLTENERKLRENSIKAQLMEQKGVKAFWYGEELIYARNQKNADKKAKKKGLI